MRVHHALRSRKRGGTAWKFWISTGHAVAVVYQIAHVHAALETEVRKPTALPDEHLEERRLGRPARRKVSKRRRIERGAHPKLAVHIELRGVQRYVRDRVELGPQSHLLERVEPAGQQHFAAKLAREVGLPLEQRHVGAATCEQKRKTRTARPGTDDNDAAHVLACAFI